MSRKVFIIGAGASGRGHVGQLALESGYEVAFVDKDRELVERLRKSREYVVHLVSARPRDFVADRFDIFHLAETEDAYRALVSSPINGPEIWRLKNGGGGWAHPIHIHLELARVLRRNGKQPPLQERDGFARKDTVNLGPGDSVDVFIKFRDFPGPFVFHCHNIEHEDLAMMARFDVV